MANFFASGGAGGDAPPPGLAPYFCLTNANKLPPPLYSLAPERQHRAQSAEIYTGSHAPY